jgi:NTP pyrophosphatase (non-canonical NTP hydrolase)
MMIDEYATWAAKVNPARLGAAASTEERQLMYLVLALAGEVGEVADHVKKVLRDGTWDRDRLTSELGDVIYYWAKLCAVAGCVPSELLERSVTTIEARIAKQASALSN